MEKRNSFWKRIRFKFRVSVLNENTLGEVFHLRLSLLSILLIFMLLLVLTIGLLSLLVVYTPIRNYLPGYVNDSFRQELVSSTIRLDSLNNEVEMQKHYSEIIKDILAGNVSGDSVAQLDSMTINERRELLLEKSKILEDFNAEYEAKEKYELRLFVGQPDVRKYVFFKPSQGVITRAFDSADNHYGITLATSKNSVVTSVLQGTVIYTDYTLENSWTIMVQHDNDYISVYKKNSKLLKRIGDIVNAGEAIAMADDKDGGVCEFELWQKGIAIDPATMIAF